MTLATLALLLWSVVAPAQAKPAPEYDPHRNAAADVAAAVKQAQKEHKRVLMVVGGEWCIWCHRLAAFVQVNQDVHGSWSARYVTVHVNFSPENENQKFLSAYPKIPGYPHIFVLDADGALLHSQDTSLLEEGASYSRLKLGTFLHKWKP